MTLFTLTPHARPKPSRDTVRFARTGAAGHCVALERRVAKARPRPGPLPVEAVERKGRQVSFPVQTGTVEVSFPGRTESDRRHAPKPTGTRLPWRFFLSR